MRDTQAKAASVVLAGGGGGGGGSSSGGCSGGGGSGGSNDGSDQSSLSNWTYPEGRLTKSKYQENKVQKLLRRSGKGPPPPFRPRHLVFAVHRPLTALAYLTSKIGTLRQNFF